jgi:hypothetical protein
MLHHFSISVNQPQRVAEVFGEILQGRVVPFPSHPGSYMVVSGDEFGTLIEFYPIGTVIIPQAKNGQCGFASAPQSSNYTPFHVAISVPIGLEEIERIAVREGWDAFHVNRHGLVELVEFWVENRLMIELLTPKMAETYLSLFKPDVIEAVLEGFIAQSAAPATV